MAAGRSSSPSAWGPTSLLGLRRWARSRRAKHHEIIAITMSETARSRSRRRTSILRRRRPSPRRRRAPDARQGRAARARRRARRARRRNAQAASSLDALPDFGLSLSGGGGRGLAVPAGGGGGAAPARASGGEGALARRAAKADDCDEPPAKPKLLSRPSARATPTRRARPGSRARSGSRSPSTSRGASSSVRVIQGLGYGLDESALAAARALTLRARRALRQAVGGDVQDRLQLRARDALNRRRLLRPRGRLAHPRVVVAALAARRRRARSRRQAPTRPARRKLTQAAAPRRTSSRRPIPRARRRRAARRPWSSQLAIDATRLRRPGRRRRSRPDRPSTPPPTQAARQFVFEPAEIDGKPAPIRILYRYEFVLRAGGADDRQLRRAGARRANEEAPRRAYASPSTAALAATTDADGSLPPRRRRAGRARGHASRAPHLTALQTTETFEAGHELAVDLRRRAAGREGPGRGPGRPRGRRRRAAAREAGRLDRGVRRRGAPGARHAGRRAQGRREPARASPAPRSDRAQLVVWGAAPQDTRVYLDGVPLPTPLPPGRLPVGRQLRHGAVGRARPRRLGRGVRARASAAWSTCSSSPLERDGDARERLGRPARRVGRRSRAPVGSASRRGRGAKELPRRAPAGLHVAQHRRVRPHPAVLRRAGARSSSTSRPRETLEIGGLLSSDVGRRQRAERRSDEPCRRRRTTRRSSASGSAGRSRPSDGAEIARRPVGRHRLRRARRPVRRSCRPNLQVDSTVASLRASWRKRLAAWVTLDRRRRRRSSRAADFSRTGSNTSPPRQGDDVRLRAGALATRSPTTTARRSPRAPRRS